MSAKLIWAVAVYFIASGVAAMSAEILPGFVYLADVAPTVRQDIRYAGVHNFTGRQVDGYQANECILTEKAAEGLQRVQAELAGRGLSLVVWDCYRPMRAVRDFISWSRSQIIPPMKAEFFPNVEKNQFFALGYLSSRSAHSRGSTVDLGLVPNAVQKLPPFDATAPLVPCTAPKGVRFEDGTIDLGTGYDCLDPQASTNSPRVTKEAHDNRHLLQTIMQMNGFKSYSREWWHYELWDEPFPGQSFDFPVAPRNANSQTKQAKAPAFWAQFKNAVLTRNAPTIAKMAIFPFATPLGELDQQSFVASFEPVFDGSLTACVATGNLEPSAKSSSDLVVRCGPKNKYDNALIFHKQSDGNWYLNRSIAGDSAVQGVVKKGSLGH